MAEHEQYTPTEESLGVAVAICQMIPVEEGKEVVSRWLAERDARVHRAAAQEALNGLKTFAKECMDGKHGEIDHETWRGWWHTWAAAPQYSYTHYSEDSSSRLANPSGQATEMENPT